MSRYEDKPPSHYMPPKNTVNSSTGPLQPLADGAATKRPSDALSDCRFSPREAFRPTIEAAARLGKFDELFKTIHESSSDVIRLYPVSQDEYMRISREREKRGQKFRLFYLESIDLLVITIPSLTHEAMQRALGAFIDSQIVAMGLVRELVILGGGRYTRASRHTLSGSGEGDGSYAPVRARYSSARRWPTFVIEVAYSQSLRELRAKGQWWFYASDFDVKIVVLSKLFRDQGVITIEKWKVVAMPRRPGAVTRASAAAAAAGETREPRCVQTIRLDPPPAHDQRMDEQAWTVTSGDLRLEFVDLFLREPAQGEGDIVIRERELRTMAASVTEVMGWEPGGT